MNYYEQLATNGGMVACGSHLGVMIGTEINACPNGWTFVPLSKATPQLVAECIAHASQGRAAWPKNASQTSDCESNTLEDFEDRLNFKETGVPKRLSQITDQWVEERFCRQYTLRRMASAKKGRPPVLNDIIENSHWKAIYGNSILVW